MRQVPTNTDNEDKYAIPTASIGDTDPNAVKQTNPAAAKEIARLEDKSGDRFAHQRVTITRPT